MKLEIIDSNKMEQIEFIKWLEAQCDPKCKGSKPYYVKIQKGKVTLYTKNLKRIDFIILEELYEHQTERLIREFNNENKKEICVCKKECK